MDVNIATQKAQRIQILANSYAVCVRAGVLTPCVEDEKWFRNLFGLGDVTDPVTNEWDRTNGVRLPITLQTEIAEEGGSNAGTDQGQ